MPDSNPDSNYEGWHFLSGDRRIATYRNADGRISAHSGKLVTPGLTLTVPGPVCPGAFGLHASQDAARAVFHAPGLVVCRVRLSGKITRETHYAAATERTVLWMADATQAVWVWLLWCAKAAIERAQNAGHRLDPATLAALEARRAWIGNEPGADTALKAAHPPAMAALRRAKNLRNGGANVKKRNGVAAPALVQIAAEQAAHLCLTSPASHRIAASRPAHYFASVNGERENEELETLLVCLPNKELP